MILNVHFSKEISASNLSFSGHVPHSQPIYTPENQQVPLQRDCFNSKYIFQSLFFRGICSFSGEYNFHLWGDNFLNFLCKTSGYHQRQNQGHGPKESYFSTTCIKTIKDLILLTEFILVSRAGISQPLPVVPVAFLKVYADPIQY